MMNNTKTRSKESRKAKPLWLKWIFCAIPAAVAALLYLLLPHFPNFTEYAITRGLFRIVGFPLEWLVSAVPFSVAEALLLLCIPAILTLLILWIKRIVQSKQHLRVFERGCRCLAWCLSFVLLFYMVLLGGNFSRVSASELLELPNRTYTAEDLYTVTCDLAAKASKARENLPEDENGCTCLSVSRHDFLLQADDCYHELCGEYPFLKTGTWRVKSVGLSHWWSYTGITGVYVPWLGEANLNTDIPACSLGFSAAHEVAHTMGFAQENECNFLSWLACSASGQPDYVYSGWLMGYIYLGNALYRVYPDAYWLLRDALPAGVRADLDENNAYWEQFSNTVVQKASTSFYDSALKLYGDERGMQSYGTVVDMLVAYYKDRIA